MGADGCVGTVDLAKISVIGSDQNELLGSFIIFSSASSLSLESCCAWGNCVRCGFAASSASRQYGFFCDGEVSRTEYAGPLPANCFSSFASLKKSIFFGFHGVTFS